MKGERIKMGKVFCFIMSQNACDNPYDKSTLGSTSLSQKLVVQEVLPKVKKGQFGKYFLKSKMVTLGSTS